MSYPILKPRSEADDKVRKSQIQEIEKNKDVDKTEENMRFGRDPRKISNFDRFEKSKDTYDFNSFTVLGNHESSNIGFCAVNQTESKCQILLRADTNTKGCLHWFMFTVKITSLQSGRKVSVSSGKKSQ